MRYPYNATIGTGSLPLFYLTEFNHNNLLC